MSNERARHLIVPIFIPNQGCPDRCVFCEQERITSQTAEPITRQRVTQALRIAIQSPRFLPSREAEIGFYGGTFTRLPAKVMEELLDAAGSFVAKGFFGSVRVSTRPDCVDEKCLDLMMKYRVRTVELGAQSLDNHVLYASRRGHTAEDTFNAFDFLKRHGFKVGIQLMPGLPGDSEQKFERTIREVIRIHPDMVRLYPTVVINGTVLASWYRTGRYAPLELEEAVRLCAESCSRLEEKGIPVIRMGLMSSPSLLEEGQILAGPWHPAFGFLVRSSIHLKKIQPYLPRPGTTAQLKIKAPTEEIPLLRGYRNRGLRVIALKTGAQIIGVEPDDSLPSGQIRVVKA